MCERLCGRRETARVRVREREGGGRISSGEDARWECVADQRAESETSRCTADGKRQVSRLTLESVSGGEQITGSRGKERNPQP